jgi:hypothetical protein
MGKYDHIPELLGLENYVGWSTKMQYALVCKDLWCHVNSKSDPADLFGQPSFIPVPLNPLNVTDAEKAAMRTCMESRTTALCLSAKTTPYKAMASRVPRTPQEGCLIRNYQIYDKDIGI